MHPMRRKKQALDNNSTIEILERGAYGVLGTCSDDDSGYCVPVNYAYDDGRIYVHSATAGHKIEALKRNPRVNFVVVDQSMPVAAELTDYFRSAMCFGTVRFADDPEEIAKGLRLLAEKYSKGYEERAEAEIASSISRARVAMLVLEIDETSGKEAIELVQAR